MATFIVTMGLGGTAKEFELLGFGAVVGATVRGILNPIYWVPKKKKPKEPEREPPPRKRNALRVNDTIPLPAFEIESSYELHHEPKGITVEATIDMPTFLMASSAEAEFVDDIDPLPFLLNASEEERRAISAGLRALESEETCYDVAK